MTDKNAELSNGNYRTLFVSDVHLGTRHCQAELLFEFLESHKAEKIYLIGDIIDGWRLKKKRYWPPSHEKIIQTILNKARSGTEIIFIPGNHDEHFRKYAGRLVREIRILEHTIHETANGGRYFVTHGDQYDVVLQNARWMAYLGDRFYEIALTSNTWLNLVRQRFGMEYWSPGAFAKRHVKSFVNIIGQFETVVTDDIRRRGVQGVICGHIHHAMSRKMNDIHYVNTGDWVESCTAVGEHFDGSLEVLYWTDPVRQQAKALTPPIKPAFNDPIT
ncbi:MAG: UDP-2,3-diacylglucosamine diphosphatase [Rhodospirillales bacterium]|nr:UDP-2,3-diacylglucosamine diphosphatase [Rhodospirillales bacterium]